MSRGFDCLSSSIDTTDNVSLYVPIAYIPKYQNDSNYTQGHRYILRIVELSTNMHSTSLAIFTSNSSQNISAYYTEKAPSINVVIDNTNSKYWRILVKPTGLYSVPIGMQIVASQNPASIVCLNGYKPIVDVSTITDKINIGVRLDYIKHNKITVPTMTDVKALVQDTTLTYNYDVAYNTFGTADRTITPENIGAMWYVNYKHGLDGYSIQTWERVNGTTYKKFIRQKVDATTWGSFIEQV